jgi:hypothetical protein
MLTYRLITGVLITVALSICGYAHATNFSDLPSDTEYVQIYLGTRDIGHQVYTKYGHTLLRIVDSKSSFDRTYNWGTFDFDEPGYIQKFLRGFLLYRMSFGSWQREVEVSRYEKQTIWMERLELTPNQKSIVLKRIALLSQPDNIKYPYQFFYDNCSTRVRDIIDEALQGQLKARFNKNRIGRTYRDRVMEHNASEPLLAMGQDIILNSEPDREMTAWDDMFIPTRMRSYLLEFPAIGDDGSEIKGEKLLSDTQELTSFPQPSIPAINGHIIMWLMCGLPMLIGMALALNRERKRIGVRIIGIGNIIFGLFFGSFGLFMSMSWAFGSHTVLPHNANLLMMWPIDFLYMIWGLKLVWRGNDRNKIDWSAGLIQKMDAIHLLLAVLAVVICATGLVEQNTTRVASMLVPLIVSVFFCNRDLYAYPKSAACGQLAREPQQ